MKAIRIAAIGGPEVLEYADIDLSPPGTSEVRVRHHAIGVNFIDTYHRSGLYPVPLPAVPGMEAAGVVEAVGSEVTTLKPGDRVGYFSVRGAYAEAANVAADQLVRLPADVSDEVAAAGLLKGVTAHCLLKKTFVVEHGQSILFHAAAGGVGLIASQWASHLGAIVIGTVGSDDKIALAKEHGCTHVLNTRTEDWVKRVREITGGRGVPVVYDGIGKDTFEGSLDCLAVRGLMVSFGNASGAVPPIAPALLNTKGSLYLTRPSAHHYLSDAQTLQAAADDLFAVIASGAVRIPIHQRYKLADARLAHEALHARATTGATILLP